MKSKRRKNDGHHDSEKRVHQTQNSVAFSEFKQIDKLSPSDFEIFVRDVFVAAGWSDAIITKVGQEFQHGDGGVDIFAYKSKRKFAIEVKQRQAGDMVERCSDRNSHSTVAIVFDDTGIRLIGPVTLRPLSN